MLQETTSDKRSSPVGRNRPRMTRRRLMTWLLLFVVLIASLAFVITLAHTSGNFPHR